MVGGASAVSQDIPPFCLAEGNRATLKGLNLTGLRRRISRDEINELKIVYKSLFESGQPLQKTAEKLLNEELLKDDSSKNIKNLLEFITKSKRGIPFIRKDING
jgi:UDP-N-acetylglucosamine acyltransferase